MLYCRMEAIEAALDELIDDEDDNALEGEVAPMVNEETEGEHELSPAVDEILVGEVDLDGSQPHDDSNLAPSTNDPDVGDVIVCHLCQLLKNGDNDNDGGDGIRFNREEFLSHLRLHQKQMGYYSE